MGINASGQVTGGAETAAGGEDAFLYDGTMHDLGTLGAGTSSWLQASTPAAKWWALPTRPEMSLHAFLYDIVHGMVDLNSLINPSSGWVLVTRRPSMTRARLLATGRSAAKRTPSC